MDVLPYDISGEVLRSRLYVVLRAARRSDRLPVLLKANLSAETRRGHLVRELTLMQRLPIAAVPRALEVIRGPEHEYLVLEDRGLQPLATAFADGRLPLDRFFRLALSLCAALADLHHRDVVLGSLTPAALLVGDQASEVQIVDLSHAQRMPVDATALAASVLASGGAPYMAPEHTGRINRTVDHRGDLYTLGAVFYDLLTGRPPFDTRDPLELVHAHIARTPRAPAVMVSTVPEQLSRIVMRLLAKSAEDRYQSASGLKHDLERGYDEWTRGGAISTFDLAQRDIADRLLIPQRLYGRESQLAELSNAFDEARDGRPALVLVAGYSGVGKTSFINELCRPIVQQRGYFIAGKFDQVARNMPYGALIQAFRSLVWQVLAENEQRLASWRAELSEALGSHAAVVASVIPDIEFIIGKQAAPVALEAVESQNRFRYVFQRFVSTFARPDHPLVIFLDDLQWVDSATIELLQSILTDPEPRSLLIIGAYRDNEVPPDHHLRLAIARLEHSNARVRHLKLASLDLRSLTSFLADTLHIADTAVADLAGLIRQKTDGNPFFVIQFLQTLRQDGLLSLDRANSAWTFRLDAIAAEATTDNVVTFMTQRIQRLSPRAQDVLRLAACIGNPFTWSTFSTATHLPAGEAETGLHEVLDAGLLRPANDQYAADAASTERGVYAFIHDRVQQAAYALIPTLQRPAVHLDVGRQLLAENGPRVPDDRLFEIVNHLNVGRGLVGAGPARLVYADLNLRAGRQAKSSAAFHAARDYLSAGMSLCDESNWNDQYSLMFALHLEYAECLHLSGEFEEAERAHARLLTRAASTLDQAAVHELRVTFYENRSRYAEAIASGRSGLALFGISLPDTDAAVERALDRELDAITERLADRSIASLVELPVMADVRMRTAMRILTLMWAPVYIAGNQRLTSLISATMVRLSLEYGNTEDSAYGYVTHAITVGPVRRQFKAAYEWGELAVAVNERFGDTKRRAKIHQQLHAHVKLWRQPFEACIPHAREAARAGLEAGDFAYAGYGSATESWPALVSSRDLARFVHDQTPALAFLDRINMIGFRDALRAMINWALALQGRTESPLSLSNEHFDESAFIERYGATAPLFVTILRCAKLHLAVVFDAVEKGADAAAQAQEITIPGTMWPVFGDFWGALALARAYDTATGDAQARYKARISAVAAALKELADSCPENFRCLALLVAAESHRIDGRVSDASRSYEQSIAYSVLTGNVQQEALANEFYGRALLARGHTPAAATHLTAAHRAYFNWGALAKTYSLEQQYGDLLLPPVEADERADATAANASSVALSALDVGSVLKVAQAISSEIELDRLFRRLLTIAIENAGAERGIFLQIRDDELVPVMEAAAGNDRVEVRHDVAWDDAGPLAHGVVRYVRRTGQDIVMSDATNDERFGALARSADAPQSVLCVPIGHQARLLGILYLQHALRGTFTAARTEIVRVLAAQAAIAFENAQLYEEMKSEVERRAAAERALREALTEVETLKNRLEAENVYLQEEIVTQHNFNDIVGNSTALLGVLRMVERVAPTESTILILGETGSGKELFARAIHSRSKRNARPLVKVNCGALPPGLVESELFGHVKGAFTGAIDKRVGRFELADGGTIFLDEIGELPLDAQVKLLRVLQEQEFEPVGSSRTVRVSVRVIAATNRNLEQAVAEGRFRADLLYRLNVFPIEIPPLRERLSDIPLLTAFFLTRIARTIGKPLQAVSARSLERMQQYSWPGNIRELQNVLERTAIFSEGSVVDVQQLLPDQPLEQKAASPARAGRLDEIQRDHILSVLRTTRGVIEGARGAATILGIHPNTLRSRMKKLGIRPGAGGA